jgi:ABC transporter substrate binding protein/Transposase, Mutator family
MARAQQPGAAGARPRIAFLALGPQQSVHLAFVDGLRRLGYAPGRNLDIDHRYGDVEQLKPLAQELIALKPDILVADSPSPAIALKSVAPTFPIVCLTLTDAGIPDLFASYARPGGNVTGMAQSVEGVTGKLVEVVLEIIPGARRIGFLANPRGASMPLFAENVDVAAHARGMTVLTEQVAAAGELASAFGRFGKQGVQAVIVPVNGLFFSEGRQIEGEHPYVYLDGIVLKRSWAGEVRNVSLLVAIGVNQSGYREMSPDGMKYTFTLRDRLQRGAITT